MVIFERDANSMIYAKCKKNDEDFEDLEDVYCSIAVTKHMSYFGSNGVEMNPEHPKFKPFIQYYVHLPAQHVNEV